MTVHIHQVVEKGLIGTLRCSVDGTTSGRWLELPVWMFDRAICLPITWRPEPTWLRLKVFRSGSEDSWRHLPLAWIIPRDVAASRCYSPHGRDSLAGVA